MIDRTVHALADRQLGLVTRDQALAAGVHPGVLVRRCRSGVWERVLPGVFRIVGATTTWDQRVKAGELASGGATSHRAAAQIWEMQGIRSGGPEVTIERTGNARLDGVTVHRSADLAPEHVVERHGHHVTVPWRTLVDLGAVVHPHLVEVALHSALRRGLVTLDQITVERAHIARRGRDGVGVMRLVLDLQEGTPPQLVFESSFLQFCRRVDLPTPLRQVPVRDAAGFTIHLDFAWPAVKLAVEAVGWEWHGNRLAFEDDARRDAICASQGWTVVPVTWRQLTDEPDWLARRLRMAMGVRRSA
jgi:Transcriptional regulator, AbiEi antitoxin